MDKKSGARRYHVLLKCSAYMNEYLNRQNIRAFTNAPHMRTASVDYSCAFKNPLPKAKAAQVLRTSAAM